MNALEELLDDALADSRDDAPSVEADWDRVTTAVATRRRRKANTYRVGVVLLISVLGFGLFSSRFGVPIESVANLADNGNPIAEAPEVGIWPSSADVAAAAGERPQSQFWIAWLIGAGLPLLAAVAVWARAPQHLRVATARQGVARIVLASSAGLAATIAVGVAVCAVLFFTYDPLAAQAGTSYVLSVLGIVQLSFIGDVVVLSLGLTTSSSDPEESIGRKVFYGLFGLLVTVWVTSAFLGIFGVFFDWRTSHAVDGPVRGLWRLFLQGDVVYSGPSGVIAASTTTFAALGGIAVAAIFIWVARTSARNVLAGAKLGSASGRSSALEPDSRSRPVRTVTWLLVALAVALPSYVYVQKDVEAQSLSYIAALPADALPSDFDVGRTVRDERDIDRGLFEQLDLVEITFHIADTRTPFAEITDEQLLPERFGFEHLGEGVVLRRLGSGFDRQLWLVERDERSRTITIGVRRESALPGMNTALFIASLLILAATSSWIPKMVSKEDVEPQAILGRRMGAWSVIAASTAVGLHLVGSLIGLAGTVGDRASRGGETIYEFYTIGARSSPAALDDISPWFLFLNVFIFVPLFGLAILGVRRLTNSAKITRALLAVTVLSPVVTLLFWGELILDWVVWFLD